MREKTKEIIEDWYQKHSLNYLGKRDCVCEIDRESVDELLKKLGEKS